MGDGGDRLLTYAARYGCSSAWSTVSLFFGSNVYAMWMRMARRGGRTGGKGAHVLEAVAALDRAGVAVAELAGYSVAHDEDGEGGHDGNAGKHGDKYSWNRGERGGRGEAER